MKLNLRQAWLNLAQGADAHKPEILTGVGLGLLVAAVPITIKATIIATKKIQEKKREKFPEEITPEQEVQLKEMQLEPVEIVKETWKYYIPTALTVGVGAFCVITSTKEGLKRTAAMAAAYQLSETAFSEYQKKVKEVIGDKKEEEVEQRVMKDRMELMTDDEGHIVNIYDTRDGATLCFDYWSGRYFYSDIDFIRRQITEINQSMLKDGLDGRASLNDVYCAIGLPQTGAGESLVWRIDKEGIIELRPISQLVDGDRPCWVLNFSTAPRYVPSWTMDRW